MRSERTELAANIFGKMIIQKKNKKRKFYSIFCSSRPIRNELVSFSYLHNAID